MKRLILLFILCTTFALGIASERIPILIDDFSFGLNTVSKGHTGVLGEGTIVHNFDLWKHPKDLTVRDGYDSVFAIPGIDSFLWNGIHAINFVDGTKKLAIVGDSDGVGYANVYVTGDGTLDFGVTDTLYVTPDTAKTSRLYETTLYPFYLLEISTSDSTYVDSFRLEDSLDNYSYEIFADTFVYYLNLNYSAWVTASKSSLGDTLIIASDSTSKPVSLTLKPYISFTVNDSSFISTNLKLERETGGISGDRIATYFPATGQLWWTQLRGITYLGTGSGKAISYDGKQVNRFPMKAPGEVDVIPLTTAGTLDGTYRYAVKYWARNDSVSDTLLRPTFGYISTAVIADNQQVMIKDFPLVNEDYYVGGLDVDTIDVEIWRTVGDVGRLDKSDYLFFTGQHIAMTSASDYSTTIVYDTASDSTLRAIIDTSGIDSVSITSVVGDTRWQTGYISTPDTVVHTYKSKPGSPSVIDWTNTATANNAGIWGHKPTSTAIGDTVAWENASGYSYMCVYVDTALNSPSDSSRSFNFYQGANLKNDFEWLRTAQYDDSTFYVLRTGDTAWLSISRRNTEKMTMVLPRATSSTSQVLLYRGAVIPTKYDSTSVFYHVDLNFGYGKSGGTGTVPTLASDSFYTPYYYLIGSYNPGDTIIDSLCYDSLVVRETYHRNAVPPLIKQMVAVDNQLLATDGQYLYESNSSADSVSFNIFSKLPINVDDGDEVTTLIVRNGFVSLLKNNSSFKLKRNSDGYWADIEASTYYGSVSPFSHSGSPEGDYFLSNDGVRLEDENIYREKSNIGSLVSGQLSNFDNMSLAQKKGCFSTYIDGKYILSFPALDMSFVRNKIRNRNGQLTYGWSTWDGVVMTGETKYAVRSDNNIYPGDTLYFTKTGSNGVYRYGTSNKDNGDDIDYRWVSHQLTTLFDGYKQISRFYLEVESDDTVNTSHQTTFADEKGSVVSELTLSLPRLDTSYTYMYEMPTAEVNRSWKAVLVKNVNVDGYTSTGLYPETIFKQLYIEMIRRGKLPLR